VVLRHPSLNDFREKSEATGIINRHHESTLARMERITLENKEAALERLEYKMDDPTRKYFLRARNINGEIHTPLRYQPRDNMERIKQSVNSNHRMNLETLNTKVLHHHVFSEDERLKWMTAKGVSHEGYKKINVQQWNEIKNANVLGSEPYIGGHKQIGDAACVRPRNQSKEIAGIPFVPITTDDRWRNPLINSNSL
jgi:hypothetical protein